MNIFDWLRQLFAPGSERPSPGDWIPSRAITVEAGRIIISLGQLNIPIQHPKALLVWIPEIPDTNSMDGLFDSGNNNLLLSSADPDDMKAIVAHLNVGDVAVYNDGVMYAIHRIVGVKHASDGTRLFKFKGDNNGVSDPNWVPEMNIQWVSIGTIY